MRKVIPSGEKKPRCCGLKVQEIIICVYSWITSRNNLFFVFNTPSRKFTLMLLASVLMLNKNESKVNLIAIILIILITITLNFILVVLLVPCTKT